MTIMLRDRPDGQVEVILNRPEVIGVMRNHDLAAQFVAFLTERDPELKLAGDAIPLPEGAESLEEIAAAADAADGVTPKRAAKSPMFPKTSKINLLPAVVALPSPPARRVQERLQLTDEQREAAFGRLGGGRAHLLCSARFRAFSGAAERRMGASLQSAAAPLGRGWAGRLQALRKAIYAIYLAPGNLCAVQP